MARAEDGGVCLEGGPLDHMSIPNQMSSSMGPSATSPTLIHADSHFTLSVSTLPPAYAVYQNPGALHDDNLDGAGA